MTVPKIYFEFLRSQKKSKFWKTLNKIVRGLSYS